MIRNFARYSEKITKTTTGLNGLRAISSTAEGKKYETFSLSSPKPFVVHVELNRPTKMNSINRVMWDELGQIFDSLNNDPDCRSIVLSGAGKMFCAGIDFTDIMQFGQDLAEHDDLARKAQVMSRKIKSYQDSVSSIERCVKPVIAAVHTACIGAGVDIAVTADIRYCAKNTWFQVKEVDLGMAADVGTLQRLPKIIGNQSLVRELCFTARKVDSAEALSIGLVNRVFDDREALIKAAIEVAETIAQKSPVGVQATKKNIVYSLDHTNQEGLNHICDLNTYLLQSEDFLNACMTQAASKGKDQPIFAKL